jgi:hypothetical protein
MEERHISLNSEVIGKQFNGIGKVVYFWLSETGREYVDVEIEDKMIISTPIDMVRPF